MKKLTAAQQKEVAALKKWGKDILPTIELKVLGFADRVQLQSMIEERFTDSRVYAEAASLGLTGKWIKDLDEDDQPLFRNYSDAQVMAIGAKVIELSGNPGTS